MYCAVFIQDLKHTELHIWSESLDRVVTSQTRSYFKTYKKFIHLHHFNYKTEVKGTPFEGDMFFGADVGIIKGHLGHPATYSDLVRIILLHNYGGERRGKVSQTGE